MVRRRPGKGGRRGAAAVEMAAVASVFLLFVFGVLEYGRLVMTLQVAESAAREGARYAVVHTDTSTVAADTVSWVQDRMAGQQSQLQGFTIQVFEADANGNNIGPPGNAAFGQYIGVQIDGTYNPILPSFLFMGRTIPIRVRSMMYSEAN